ncbi:MAG: hypothetical protein L0Z70_08995 [Chloroflexi bacterium]|nr:hypothetical protein [Chloroflexota bacterium]
MNTAGLGLADFVGGLAAFALTLMVFSYFFGDNALFRLALHIFIGVASGLAAVIAWYSVLWPQLVEPLVFGAQWERLYLLPPLLLVLLLLFKITPRLARLGNPSMGYLAGVGMAAAVGGAVLGTIFPQINAAIAPFDRQAASVNGNLLWQIFQGSVILVGAAASLAYYHFGVNARGEATGQRPRWIEALAWVGQIFTAAALGALFAGVYAAVLTAFIERLAFLADFIFQLFGA